jgi:hypothetical protein
MHMCTPVLGKAVWANKERYILILRIHRKSMDRDASLELEVIDECPDASGYHMIRSWGVPWG